VTLDVEEIRQAGRLKKTGWDCVKDVVMESLGLSQNDALFR